MWKSIGNTWTVLPPIRVFNTLGRRLEYFEPLRPGLVRMYTCGPTVYDYTHLGHARTYVAFDAMKRYLVLRGYNVVHVQNITDIDDKIIDKAHKTGKDWREIVDYYTRDYLENLRELRVVIDVHPRVTDHIGEIIEFIQGLLDKGYAYVAHSGSVYFDVTRYEHYGELSGRLSQDQWRQEEEVLKEKRNPFDFALWKAWRPGEPYWEAPWGRGRPGWHIECSVMSSKYLGDQFDIHGGGQDLIFPHHENERAQSEAFFGKRPWVKYWVHTGYLTIRGEKMAKSLGNIIVLKSAIREWGARTLRLWLLSAHYRTQLNFSDQALEQARANLERLQGAYDVLIRSLRGLDPHRKPVEKELELISKVEALRREFHEAMSNDFNTAVALSAILRLSKLVESELVPTESYVASVRALKLFKEFNAVFDVIEERRAAAEEEALVERLIDLLVRVRQKHRERKEYEIADWIREELGKLGIRLLDYPGGKTVWKIEGRPRT